MSKLIKTDYMNISYRKTANGICVERCYTLDNKLVIPDTIEGLPVTGWIHIHFPRLCEGGSSRQ